MASAAIHKSSEAAELLGMEGGRRMSIREQMTHPFTHGWKALKERFVQPMAVSTE